MERLNAPDELLRKYKVLKREDLKASKAVVDPTARGQRNAGLPWLWTIDVPEEDADNPDSDWFRECMSPYCFLGNYLTSEILSVNRVQWLRSKARRDRWREDHGQSTAEMLWIPATFRHRALQWKQRENGISRGHDIYAARWSAMWTAMAAFAYDQFSSAMLAKHLSHGDLHD